MRSGVKNLFSFLCSKIYSKSFAGTRLYGQTLASRLTTINTFCCRRLKLMLATNLLCRWLIIRGTCFIWKKQTTTTKQKSQNYFRKSPKKFPGSHSNSWKPVFDKFTCIYQHSYDFGITYLLGAQIRKVPTMTNG